MKNQVPGSGMALDTISRSAAGAILFNPGKSPIQPLRELPPMRPNCPRLRMCLEARGSRLCPIQGGLPSAKFGPGLFR